MQGKFILLEADPAVQATWIHPGASLYGVFNTSGEKGQVTVQLPDGAYADLLSGTAVRVQGGKMAMPESAAILRCAGPETVKPLYCDLLDYSYDR
jgi:hypothetical protein